MIREVDQDVLPYSIYSRVESVLGDAKFIDVSERIRQMRSVKSEFEIGLIKEAAKMLDAGISSVPECLEEGIREVDLAIHVESVMRSMGHQGSLRFRRFNCIVPLGHFMSGPDAVSTELSCFANRWERYILIISTGRWISEDKKERACICGYRRHIQWIHRRCNQDIFHWHTPKRAGGCLSCSSGS